MNQHRTKLTTRRAQLLAIALVALGLGGCHHMYRGGGKSADPTQPKVAVVDGKVTVDQVVLYFPPSQGPVTITWSLPSDGKLVFDERIGIVFEPRAQDELVNCRRGENNPQVFTCVNRHSRKDAFRYDINVIDGGKRLTRDPFVVNDL